MSIIAAFCAPGAYWLGRFMERRRLRDQDQKRADGLTAFNSWPAASNSDVNLARAVRGLAERERERDLGLATDLSDTNTTRAARLVAADIRRMAQSKPYLEPQAIAATPEFGNMTWMPQLVRQQGILDPQRHAGSLLRSTRHSMYGAHGPSCSAYRCRQDRPEVVVLEEDRKDDFLEEVVEAVVVAEVAEELGSVYTPEEIPTIGTGGDYSGASDTWDPDQ